MFSMFWPRQETALGQSRSREQSPADAGARWRLFHFYEVRRHERQIDVGGAVAPSDRELEHARFFSAAFVDDAVAVVVDGVEAKLGSSRHAGLLQHTRRQRDVRDDGRRGLPSPRGSRTWSRAAGAERFGFITSKNAPSRAPHGPGSFRSAISTPFSFMNFRISIAAVALDRRSTPFASASAA
jgi:hypothetical protein